MIIEGAISVKAAISNSKRKVNKVYIDKSKKTKDFNYIRKIVKENNIELVEEEREKLEELTKGKSFGGVLAETEKREFDKLTDGDIFFLDGIEDPFNLGYIIRNLYAFGIKNIMLNDRDYENMEPQLLKSSAGAYDFINIHLVKDVEKEILSLKEKGYVTYALMRSDSSKDIFDVNFNNPSLIIVGGEKRGIASNILKHIDNNLFIPYGADFRNALNACNAVGVVSTLLFKQRKQ